MMASRLLPCASIQLILQFGPPQPHTVIHPSLCTFTLPTDFVLAGRNRYVFLSRTVVKERQWLWPSVVIVDPFAARPGLEES